MVSPEFNLRRRFSALVASSVRRLSIGFEVGDYHLDTSRWASTLGPWIRERCSGAERWLWPASWDPTTGSPSPSRLDQPTCDTHNGRNCSVNRNRHCLKVVDRFRAASNQSHHEAGQMTAPDRTCRTVRRKACINGAVHRCHGLGGTQERKWTTVFASERLTGALLDRITHHVHILEMNGKGYRLKQSRSRRRHPSEQPPLVPVGPQAPPTREPTPAARRARRPARGFFPWTTGTSCHRDPGTFLRRYIFTPPLTGKPDHSVGAGHRRPGSH